jgi:uncharacterized protein (DUF58 family)
MIPTRRILYVLLVLLFIGILTAIYPDQKMFINGWYIFLCLIGIIVLLDALLVLKQAVPKVERLLPDSFALGITENVQLRIEHKKNYSLKISIYDHHPLSIDAIGLPQQVELKPGGVTKIDYKITPTERGEITFSWVQLHIFSVFGFWKRNHKLPLLSTIRVYPNFSSVAKYTLLAADNQLKQMGIRRRRRRGEGQNFHQLREYREGDPMRQIDWKASSRHRKLISREYQEERDQDIIFLLDCGHRMTARDDTLSHFDHSLNAILLLAYVALRQGDAIGFGNFSGEERWLQPIKGSGRISHLFNTLYDIQPTSEASDFITAANKLMLRQKKRALVILITNLRDEDNADLLPAIKMLQRKHLVLVASMREQALDNVLEHEVDGFNQAIQYSATREYLSERSQAITKLQLNGALCIDVNPQDLSVSLVNQYLEIKSSNML